MIDFLGRKEGGFIKAYEEKDGSAFVEKETKTMG